MLFRESQRRTRGVGDLLPWAALVDDGIVLNKDGSFLAGYRFRGPDLDSATSEELAALSLHVNALFASLGNGWMLHVDAERIPSPDYPPEGAFPDPVTRLIDEERRQQYQRHGGNFETRFTLLLTWMPPDERSSAALAWLVEGEARRGVAWEKVLEGFGRRLQDLGDQLSSRLALHRLDGEALLTHLHATATGQRHRIGVPPNPCYLDFILGTEDLVGGFAPRLGRLHLKLLAVHGFPAATSPGILDALGRLPFPVRWSTRFLFLDPDTAAKDIGRFRRNWFQRRKSLTQLLREAAASKGQVAPTTFVNQDADAMAKDADNALAKANSQAVGFGYYTSTLVLADEDPNALDEHVRLALKEIRNRGFSVREEDVNAVEAWRGALPGNGYSNVRRPMLSTLNLAHLLPLTAVWPGDAVCPSPLFPERSPALLLAATAGSTPFALNLHVSDVGHTLVVGPTGAGKSALIALLQAQWMRYPRAQIYTFDKGYSSLPLVLAAGGRHYDLAAESVDKISFAPLSDVHRDEERLWAADWLETLLVLSGLALTPADRGHLERALSLLGESPHRTLTDFTALLQSARLRDALRPYTLAGSFGKLLDADEDGFVTRTPFQVIEVSHLMQLGNQVVNPLLLYLFRRIERSLDGRPTLIVLEEAWTFLGHPAFASRIAAWLKELRKRNAAVVFATQSLGDLDASPLRHVLYESCPTKILLPNPEAANPQGAAYYERLGLNPRQIEIVARSRPKRDYYTTSPAGRRLIDLTLGPVALAFLGSASAENLREIRDLALRLGPSWPAIWLGRRGLDSAATTLETLRNTTPCESVA